MSKQKLKHIRSGVENKKPTPEQIDLGVIAVNFNTNNPFLSIKDSNDEIVSFPSEKGIEPIVETEVNEVAPGIIQEILPTVIGEDYYTKQQTDAEINSLSASTDTKLEQKADKSEIPSLDGYATEQWVTDQHYLTEHQDISGLATKQEVEDGLAGKSNTGHTHTVSDITNFPSIPTSTSDLTNDSDFITSGYTYSKTESDDKYALKGDVPTDVYTKSETDAAISAATDGLASETWVQSQGYLTEHQDISNLATKQEVETLSGDTDTKLALKADATDIPDVSNYFDDAQYDSNTKRINFYHGETIKAYVDATDFIKDGMVDNVDIETLSGSTYLVITFNTDSGKEPINIPIADIFNAANYYTKSEVDNAITGATQDMATQTWVTSQGYLTQHQDISNLATKQEVETLSGDTDTKLAGKQDTLIAGEGISISGNTISATGGGGSSYTAGRGIGISGDTIYNTWKFSNGLNLNEYNNIVTLDIPLRNGSATNSLISSNVGYSSTASGELSIAYGYSNKASGKASIAIGGLDSYTEGNTASGLNSLAIGRGNQASEFLSIAKGYHNNSTNQYEETGGRFNVSHKASDTFGDSGNTLFSVGNGTNNNSRHNAFEIRQNGDIYITKDGSDVKLQDQLGGGGSITIDPALDPTSSNAVANSAITEAISAKFDASGITDYYTSTEVDNAISESVSGKQDTLIAGEGISISGNTISATGGGGGGGMTEDTELLLATAITDLNDRKADRSVVNSKFSGLNQKLSNYVTTTALNTRLADYETALDEQNIEEVAAYALNDLNIRKQDKLIAGEGISISGNTISATGGGGGGSIIIDSALDPSSPNAVANSAITESLSAKFDASGITDYYTSTEVDNAISGATAGKQDTLIAGEGISISGNTISATGGGGGGSQVQADWSQNDNTAVDYIKNKPTIPTTTSSVTSGSTACIESGAVYTQFDGMQLKKITQADYDLLPTKDSNTLYIIINNN